MKIVSPGIAVRDTPSDIRRSRLGRLTCAAIVIGWALTALGASLQGTMADRNAWLLAAVGAATGLTWATKRWSEQSDRSLQVLFAAASLQACAAGIAFDRGVTAAWAFALLLALLAGQIAGPRRIVAAQATLLAAGQLLAATLGPDRAATAAETGLVVAAAVLLIAMASRAARELHDQSSQARTIAGDADRLHDRLAASVAADPERFALLTMDVHGLDAGAISALGRRLAEQVRGEDLVARASADSLTIVADTDEIGAAALARRVEEAMAQYQLDEIGQLNAAIGIAIYPQDGRTPDALLASADAALEQLRAAAGALKVTASALR